jgi:tetratricopeptide (TPR) repeat protein
MNKILLAMLLVAASTAVAQTAAPAQTAPSAQTTPAPAPKKEMKDPAEYNAYMGAEQQTDDAAKISGFEAFLKQFPNSSYKEDALELLMIAYQKTNNQPKMLETADRILQVNPCNLRALALVAYSKQAAATGPSAQQSLAEAGQAGEKGLQCLQTATPSQGMSPADWDKLKQTTSGIFNNAAGMAAYTAKDFAKAEKYLRAAVEADPTNLTQVYYLGLAYLAPGAAEDDVNGLFFIARAVNLQTGAGKDQIAKFGKSRYVKYHGTEEGWNDLLAKTGTTTLPPADFAITKYVPPTPAEQAATLVKSKKVQEMSFAEWQMVLSEGTPEDSEKVWSELKGKPLQMVAHIISIDATAKPTALTLAGSSDDIDAKRADINLTMAAALTKVQMPKEDTDFQFEGTPASFVAKPFVMTMTDGALLVNKAAPKPAAHRKPASQ